VFSPNVRDQIAPLYTTLDKTIYKLYVSSCGWNDKNIFMLDARYDRKQIGTQPARVVSRVVDTERGPPPLSILTGPKPTSQSFRVIDLKSFTITEKANMRS
jgi:hypothetical protein